MTDGGFLLSVRAMSSGLTWTAELFVVAIDEEVLPICEIRGVASAVCCAVLRDGPCSSEGDGVSAGAAGSEASALTSAGWASALSALSVRLSVSSTGPSDSEVGDAEVAGGALSAESP